MKFAKEIEEDLVPEWRAKYFDYKQAKKRIKAVTRAIRNAHKSPSTPFLRSKSNTSKPAVGVARSSTWQSGVSRTSGNSDGRSLSSNEDDEERPLQNPKIRDAVRDAAERTSASAIRIPGTEGRDSVYQPGEQGEDGTITSFAKYGSIIGSPPSRPPSRPATLRLPEAAMSSDSLESTRRQSLPSSDSPQKTSGPYAPRGTLPHRSISNSAFEIGKTKHPFKRNVSFTNKHFKSMTHLKRISDSQKPLLQRMFHHRQGDPLAKSQTPDVPMEALKDIDKKQDEFFSFLDNELEKIEAFYTSKEEEATNRLQVLREQLHVMRDQRLQELVKLEQRREERKRHRNGTLEVVDEYNNSKDDLLRNPGHITELPHALDILYHPIKAARQVHFTKRPRNPNNLATPPTSAQDANRDYTPRPKQSDIPYPTAKRKLKAALQEFYRGLELLKSYALLNRTAFRKINKKYDKAVQARPTMRYMNEKVSNANFVTSTVVDGYITAIEDLYARYFEKGSHKIAVGKLRRKNRQAGSYTGSVFRNGLLAGLGLVLGIEAAVYSHDLLHDSDAVVAGNTSYLLQLYGGYFLLLYLFLFFCFDCRFFHENKVNYVFVFEFDTRSNLDWRQLAEIPCFCLFLLGITMWLNFKQVGGEAMFVYYPVILIGVTLSILLWPFPTFYHESRKWLLYSLHRLWFGSGLYPVEFRDFFLGDMFCSQTYAMGNIEVFFCLYAHNWTNLAQCNSSHSRLQGFFSTLPGVWRALQCMRRYYDTKSIFPHVVNLGKYSFTILAGMSLSLFRINRTVELRGLFIAFSSINSIYCSFWDLNMDWSLLDPDAEHRFLREHLAYKQTWIYYVAMVLDVLLRFNWVFYVAFPFELQHSAILSFAIAISEVTRRGIWTIFRVENEHCTNVGRFRASRDVALPYPERKVPQEAGQEEGRTEEEEEQHAIDRDAAAAGGDIPGRYGQRRGSNAAGDSVTLAEAGAAEDGGVSNGAKASGADIERQWWSVTDTLRKRQRRGIDPEGEGQSAWRKGGQSIRSRIGNILRRAHAQDFERKRTSDEADEAKEGADSDDEDDEAQHAEEEESEIEDGDGEHHVQRSAESRSRQHARSADGEDEEAREAADSIARETTRLNRADMNDAEAWLHRARSGQE